MTRRAAIVLSPGLSLPLEMTTESTAIIGIRRSGKSHTAKHVAEQLHAAGQQIVCVDPKGDWWGMRSAADGKAPGIPIVILGGEHGDLPLDVTGGELVARMVVEQTVSIVLDLSAFRKGEIHRFATAFLETLYRLKGQEKYRTPMALIIDEADIIAPQAPRTQGQKGGFVEQMLGAVDDCVRRGGQRGIGVVLVTQRPAVLNKNVLSQCGILMLLRLTGKNDIDAIDAWIAHHSQEEQADKVMASIAALPRGDVWVWAPGWPDERGIFQRIHVDPNWTFDSGKTPEIGKARVAPKMLADVDLVAFKAEMAEAIEKAKADDPTLLRRRIRELEQRVAGAEDQRNKLAAGSIVAAEPQVVEKPIVLDDDLELLRALVADLRATVDRIEKDRESLAHEAQEINATAARLQATIDRAMEAQKPVVHIRSKLADMKVPITPALAARRAREAAAHEPSTNGALDAGQRKVLTAIAQQGPAGAERDMLTTVTGYKRSTRNRLLQELARAGYISDGPGGFAVTGTGLDALGDYERLPTGDKLRYHWLERLPEEGERQTLKVICDSYPAALTRESVSSLTGYARSTRNRLIQQLARRRLVTTDGAGVRASNHLFSLPHRR